MAAPSSKSKRLRELRLDPSKVAGSVARSGGGTVHDDKPSQAVNQKAFPASSRTNSNVSNNSSSDSRNSTPVQELTLELRRALGESLGMVLGVVKEEETEAEAKGGTSSRGRGRSVVVKSVTPAGAAARAVSSSASDVSRCGFHVGDHIVRIDHHDLDELDDEGCVAVLQDIPEHCTVVVQRHASSEAPTLSPTAYPKDLSTFSMTSSLPTPKSSSGPTISSSSPSSPSSSSSPSTPTSSVVSPQRPTRSSARRPQSSSTATSAVTTASQPSADGGGGGGGRDGGGGHVTGGSRPPIPKPTPSARSPKPPPRKVRRQLSTAAHLAEKGLPGFVVRRVTVHRTGEGQSLGISVVPSFGATKFYYQVKRLLPGGACAQSGKVHVGDRLLECNGRSLQNLTQAQCLDILKASGEPVTLSLLHELGDEAGDSGRGGDGGGVGVGVGGGSESSVLRAALPTKGDVKKGSEVVVHGDGSSRVAEDVASKHGAQLGKGTRDHQPVAEPSDECSRVQQNRSALQDRRHPADELDRKDPTHHVTTKTHFPSDNNDKNTVSDTKDHAARSTVGDAACDNMSNPFLDPPPPMEDGVLASTEGDPHHFENNGMAGVTMNESNPFYQDIFGGEPLVPKAAAGESSDALVDVGFGDGLLTDDIVLDVSGGDATGQSAATAQANGAGGMDWLCGDNNGQFGQADDGNIPPPMEFSDLGFGGGVEVGGTPNTAAAGKSTGPVTNIDDLLGVDLSETTTPASMTVSAGERKLRGSSGSSKSDDGFDFLMDAEEANEEAGLAAPLLAEIVEEEPPQLPSGPPPPVPSGPPPPIPRESFPDSELVADQDVDSSFQTVENNTPGTTTSVFLPSDNPSDNVTQIAVSPAATGVSRKVDVVSNNPIHVTDITVTTPASNVSAINVTKPRPAPRVTDQAASEASLPGAAVVTVDNSGGVNNTTQIQFDTSTQETVVKAAVPLNAFRPTSVGITRAVKNRNQTRDGGDAEEEEEITPMAVHRDHLGNKLAAPSPPETLGKQNKLSPRKMDEEAKRGLQNILGQMSKKDKSPRGGVSRLQNGTQEEDAPTVTEDEIVPVKLTRKEAETAQDVLSKWVTSEPGSSTKQSSSASSGKASGFQKLAGTVIDAQSGKIQLPANSAFITTIGITKTPKPRKQEGEEEEAEEEITPMTVHRDHMGNKRYAPSPPESLGKRSGVDASRTLDPSAREDIAVLMSGMTTSIKSRSTVKASSSSEDADSGVVEDEIVATVLTKEEARIAMDSVTKWMSGGDGDAIQTPSKPSPFQRLVGDVMHSASVDTPDAETERIEDFKDETKAQIHKAVDEGDISKSDHQVVEESSIQSSKSSSISSAPSRREPAAPPEVKQVVTSVEVTQVTASLHEAIKQKPSEGPPVSPKPSPAPHVKPKGSLDESRAVFEHKTVDPVPDKRPTLRPVQIPERKPPAATAPPTRAVELKPVPAQRVGGLRAPLKISSLSSLSSARPVSKLGTLSVSNRGGGVGSAGGVPSLTATSSRLSSTTSVEYGKTRSDQEPFLVEVLKGIVGLGIKVKVNEQGHVEVTEVQKNSPVDKNGNVKAGDFLLAVNTTELNGLVEGRVQQVLRLLPRGVVKLVVSTKPPASNQGSDSAAPTSPRTLGAYSQYGVRLAPQPYSPTSSDGSPPSLTSSAAPVTADETNTTTTTTAASSSTTPITQPLAISVGEEEDAEEDEDDDDDMATRKLSKALSPRPGSTQSFHPEPLSPPKPSPRLRGTVPASLSPRSRSSSSTDEAQSPVPAPLSPNKIERKMTPSEIVAAASRRPSGLDTNLPDPETLSPRRMSPQTEEEEVKAQSSFTYENPPPPKPLSPTVGSFVAAPRSPAGAASPRDEVLPVFAETANKLTPVPTPRAKPRSSSSASDGKQDGADFPQSPKPNDRDAGQVQADDVKSEANDTKPTEMLVHAHAVNITNGTPPQASPAATTPRPVKIPPPVAPKPKRTSSVTSDQSSTASPKPDETAAPQDIPSPTLVPSKLRDFADVNAPSAKDQADNRKKVTSAARMFEQKAVETTTKTVPALTQPTKSSRSVSSVVERFNRDPEPEPPSNSRQTGVTMRKISVGVSSSGGEGGRAFNSALLPPSERRKSAPIQVGGSSSFQLTKPSSRFKDPPLSSRSAGPDDPDSGDKSSRYSFSSSLRPRSQASSNTTSLKSVIASRDARASSPPAVGKDRGGRLSEAVTLRSRNYQHDSPEHDVARSLRHTSWSPQSSGAADPHSPKMIFTSSSLHQSDRFRHHDHSTPSRPSGPPDQLESTMKKFDDLLSDKHTLDSDDELPRVSNSVSLDLLKSRNAGRVAASMKATSGSEPAQEPPSSAPETKDLEPKATQESVCEDVSSKSPEKVDAVKESEPSAVESNKENGIGGKDAKEVTGISKSVVHEDSIKKSEAGVAEAVSRSQAKAVEESTSAQDVVKETVQEHVRPKTRRKPVDEYVGDTYPEEDTAAEPPMDMNMAADAYPEQDAPAAPPVDHMTKDAYPEHDQVSVPSADIKFPAMTHAEEERAVKVSSTEASPRKDEADETAMYEQQASMIVKTVVSNALNDVAQDTKEEKKEEQEEAEYDAPPPPLPDEAPPPLPGAPPPPLIMRNEVKNLVAPEDLVGMLPSQDSRSSKSPSPQVSPRVDSSLAVEDRQADREESISAETLSPSFTLPESRDLPGEEEEQPREQPVTDSDVLIAFDSAPSGPLSLSVDMDLLRSDGNEGRGNLPGGKGLDHDQHGDNNPPVSDTLSQDSGVQDEDMSEDGLRFSQDESPTSHGGESSSSMFDAVAMVTPDEIPASVMMMNDANEGGSGGITAGVVDAAGADVEAVESDSVTKPSPVPSPRASPRVTLSRPSPPSPSPRGGATRLRHDPPSPGTCSPDDVAEQPTVVVGENDSDSLSQGSSSPRCSSGRQGTTASSPRGGVSTNGEHRVSHHASEVEGGQEKQDVQSVVRHTEDSATSKAVNKVERDSAMLKDVAHSNRERKPSSPRLSEQPPPPPPPASAPPTAATEENNGDSQEQEDAFTTTDGAELVSTRKWCILDQSGSMFLNGPATTPSTPPVSITMATLRQVSSMMPLELAAMLKEGNHALDSANLPKTLEMRIVSSRSLNGRPVSVDVTQRQDYFVQLIQVHTKNCCLEEADLLLSIDGRTMKNKRPAQVHAAIDATGPKGTMLTARGVKLPHTLSRPSEAKTLDPSSPRTASPTPTTPTTPTSLVPAVEVSPGVYDVTMVKGATGVGFCLEGGKASPMGDLPILIKRIFKGGPAEKCGQLKVKDEIVMVNGVDFTILRHYEAWNHLKFLDDGPVKLRIRRSES